MATELMKPNPTTQSKPMAADAVWLAASVRVLAREVRRVERLGGRPQDVDAVTRRIDSLLADGVDGPVRRWLENLRAQVEARRAPSPSPAHHAVDQTA